MTSLFVYFIHGGKSTLKMAMKASLLKEQEGVITLGVNYEQGAIEILGCSVVTKWMLQKEIWFTENPTDPLAIYKQLLNIIKNNYIISPQKICFYAEGNFGVLGGDVLEQVVIDLINYTQPAYALLPTGTPKCCKFINHWIDHHNLPRFVLGENVENLDNYYALNALTEEERDKLENAVQIRQLTTCLHPYIATFEKSLSRLVIQEVLLQMAQLKNTSFFSKQSSGGGREDDVMYFFDQENLIVGHENDLILAKKSDSNTYTSDPTMHIPHEEHKTIEDLLINRNGLSRIDENAEKRAGFSSSWLFFPKKEKTHSAYQSQKEKRVQKKSSSCLSLLFCCSKKSAVINPSNAEMRWDAVDRLASNNPDTRLSNR